MPPALVVFSHLRWDFVFQRPQHLMQRLAKHRRVYFFEEPETGARTLQLTTRETAPGVVVCRVRSPLETPGFHDQQLPLLKSQLEALLQRESVAEFDAWLYTPMALPLLDGLMPRTVIYDCMDELSAFRNAPRQLLQRESALLKLADVVFTGGPSLFAAKRTRHPDVHCFPSSVDAGHFARALDGGIDHPLQRRLPAPRLGFYGVIDERFDTELLATLADAHPEWQLVMVGPVAKIEPSSLPRRDNIHWFGQQSYDALPQFVAGWDVCLQPFALNEATRFISPTKTLEYMAAEKPIVSTAIRDVADPYGHLVYIADSARDFVAACEAALAETAVQRARRREGMRRTVAETSWDATAAQMHERIEAAAQRRQQGPLDSLRETLGSARHRGPRRAAAMPAGGRPPILVLGAGPTGLSAGHHLGEDSLILEQNSTVGGWCRSIQDGGFTFDYAGHIMFSNDPYVHELYQKLLGDNVHWQDREAWVYSKNTYTRYPFQGALHGLPPQVLKECIVGAIEARFGALKAKADPKPTTPARASSSTCEGKAESITDSIHDCCADGIAESTVPLAHEEDHVARARAAQARGGDPANFEEFIYRVWGSGIARHFAIPYNRKLWAVPLDEMETSWLGGRVPLPDLEDMIDGALQPVPKPQGPNARFGYPLRGGFQALVDGFLPLLRGGLETDAEVVKIDVRRRQVALADGRRFAYRRIVSTLPLPRLVQMLGDAAPARVQEAARRLRHVSVRCVNLGVARENVTDKHWIYYPEDTVFHRIFVQGNASPHCNAPGGFGLTCEITHSPTKPLPCGGDALIDLCIEDCIRVGLLRADDRILVRNQVEMPYAYVVYDHARRQSVDTIRNWLLGHGIHLAGRYSEWEYYNSDHAFVAGRNVALAVRAADAREADQAETLRATQGARAAVLVERGNVGKSSGSAALGLGT